jgi:hypothetical protein
MGPIVGQDLEDLRRAVELLEEPRLVAQLSDCVGAPVEALMEALPDTTREKLLQTVQRALEGTLRSALTGMKGESGRRASELGHKLAAGISGAVGGAFGLPALAVELPVSTGILLRSIADIARSEGEDVQSLETRLQCIQVFALGGRTTTDDAAESGYFAVRAALAAEVTAALRFLGKAGVSQTSGPAITRLMAAIASRFGVVVSQKIAAQAVPVIGALGGATVNLLFANHFQRVARGHFIYRRLERDHDPERTGEGVLADTYRQLRDELARARSELRRDAR